MPWGVSEPYRLVALMAPSRGMTIMEHVGASRPSPQGALWRRRSVIAGLVAGTLILATGGMAAASAPGGASATLRACSSNHTGALRLLRGFSQHCDAGESPVSWNVAGQPGPHGPAGATGPSGPPGTGVYARYYYESGSTYDVPGEGYLQFPSTGDGSFVGDISKNLAATQFTFNLQGTYLVTVCVPFTSPGGTYRMVYDGTPVSGSTAGDSVGGGSPTCESVVLSAATGSTFGIQNPAGSGSETVGDYADSQLLFLQISTGTDF